MLPIGSEGLLYRLKNGFPGGRYWPGFLLVVLFFLLFSPSLPYSFINFDDNVYLYENPLVTDFNLSKIKDIFSSEHTSLFSPLVVLSYALEYQVWGPNPLYFRLINFLLHAGSILLLYSLCLQMFGGRSRAFWVSLLFALHLLRIESLVWVTERKDALFVFFVLLTLHLYLKYLRGKDNSAYILALFTLSIAMLANASVTAVDIGMLGFYTDSRIVDLVGLTDPVVAHSPGGHLNKKFNLDHLFVRHRPEALILRSTIRPEIENNRLIRCRPGSEIEGRILMDKRLLSDYRLMMSLEIKSMPRQAKLLFMRRDHALAGQGTEVTRQLF